jgi:hypothetical protein
MGQMLVFEEEFRERQLLHALPDGKRVLGLVA